MSDDFRLRNRWSFILRWLARLGSIASGAMLILFAVGGQESVQFLSINEVVGFCLFPIGIVAGMAVGWRYELLGGTLTLLSLAGFHVWHFVNAGQLPTGPYFMLFALPGVLFLPAAFLQSIDKQGAGSVSAGSTVDKNAANQP